MLKTNEDYFAALILVFIIAPSLWGLFIVLFKLVFGKIYWCSDDLIAGMTIHILNAFISPGIPAYLFYLDKHTGGGSVASLLSIPLIPVTWLIYFIGRRRVAKAESPVKEVSTTEFATALSGAIEQYRLGQTATHTCPACSSIVRIGSAGSTSSEATKRGNSSCDCGRCSGTYDIKK